MSGVPVIISCFRLLFTVERPLRASTMTATPNTMRTAPAMKPPISRTLLMNFPPEVSCCQVRSRDVSTTPGNGPGAFALRESHEPAMARPRSRACHGAYVYASVGGMNSVQAPAFRGQAEEGRASVECGRTRAAFRLGHVRSGRPVLCRLPPDHLGDQLLQKQRRDQ